MRRLLRPSTTPSADGAIRRITASSACGLNSHVRISTLLSIPQALSLLFIRILPSDLSASLGDLLCQPPYSDLLRTVSTPRVLNMGAFAHLIRISPSQVGRATIRRIAVSSACGLNSHVRISTLLSIPQALSLHFIRILPSAFEHDVALSETVLRAAQPSVHRRCNRLLNAAAR